MRRLLAIIAVLTLVLQNICLASEQQSGVNSYPITITEDADSIDIYANVYFTGSIKDDYVPNTSKTYTEAFIYGVKYVWNGEYNGKVVDVHIKTVDEETYKSTPCIKVIISSVTGRFSYCQARKSTNTIWLYSGDGRMGLDYLYNYSGMLYVSGHEFGHMLGLGDAYNDSNENVKTYLSSPMNGWNYKHATKADYFVLLNNKTWMRDTVFEYSQDREFLKWYLPI